MRMHVWLSILLAMSVSSCAFLQSGKTKQQLNDTLSADLRNLVTAQEAYFSAHATYSDDLSALSVKPGKDVIVEFSDAGAAGWAAIAYHKSSPGDFCAVFVGKPASIPGQANKDAVPACSVRLGGNPEARIEGFMRLLRRDLR